MWQPIFLIVQTLDEEEEDDENVQFLNEQNFFTAAWKSKEMHKREKKSVFFATEKRTWLFSLHYSMSIFIEAYSTFIFFSLFLHCLFCLLLLLLQVTKQWQKILMDGHCGCRLTNIERRWSIEQKSFVHIRGFEWTGYNVFLTRLKSQI
jgi:hypothetical protein